MKTNNKQKLVMIDGRKRRRQIEHRSFSRADVFKSLENLRLDRVQDAAVERRSNRNGLDMEIELWESTDQRSGLLVRGKRKVEDTLENRLQEFVEKFVFFFEETLSAYSDRLEKQTNKAGKWADLFKVISDIPKSGTEAVEVPGAKAGGLIAINLLQYLISSTGSKLNRDQVKAIANQLHEFNCNAGETRKELIKSGIEIFKSFEDQFKDVTAYDSWQQAMKKLSHDAVGRVINYYRGHSGEKLELTASVITKGFVLGGSKKYTHTFGEMPHLFNKGHTVNTPEGKKWNTAELFEKVGIIKDRYYYENKKDYRFRLSFEFEDSEFPTNPIVIGKKITINGKKYIRVEQDKPYSSALNLESKEKLEEKEKYILEKIEGQNKRSIESQFEKEIKEIKVSVEKIFQEIDKHYYNRFDEITNAIKNEIQLDKWWPAKEELPNSFIERHDEGGELLTKKLHAMLKAGNSAAITGLGGIGKTTTAKWYADADQKEYDHIFWIESEKNNAVNQFKQLAERLKIKIVLDDGTPKDTKIIASEIYTKLKQKCQNECLFIFNNADGYKDIKDLLPRDTNFHTLITSRNKNWGTSQGKGKIEQLALDIFSEQEAIAFIKKEEALGSSVTIDHAKDLAQELGYLPLALQQAVAYIKKNKETITNYLEKYKKAAGIMLNTGELDDYHKTVLKTWQVTFEKIKDNKNFGELATKIFDIMAYLSPKGITKEILKKLPEATFLDDAIGLLNDYSMIKETDGQIEVHRLVQEVVRIKIREEGKEEKTLKEALKLTQKNLNEKTVDHAISVWDHASKYDELVKEFSIIPSEIIEKLDNSYEFGKKAFEVLTEKLEESNPSIKKLLGTKNKYENELLYYACKSEEQETVELFLKSGAEVDARRKGGITALAGAVRSKNKKIVEILLGRGADPNIESDWPPIHNAIQGREIEIIKVLLKNGANPNLTGKDGITPLYYASKRGEQEIVELLLDTGAEVNPKKGWAPLYGAVKGGNIKIVKLLLDKGANPNPGGDKLPLYSAAENGKEKIVELLLENGAEVDAKNEEGKTALHTATKKYKAIVEKLLDRGADINLVDNEGKTALHIASFIGKEEIAKLLIEKGAKLDIKDKEEKTALDYAERNKKTGIKKILKEAICSGRVKRSVDSDCKVPEEEKQDTDYEDRTLPEEDLINLVKSTYLEDDKIEKIKKLFINNDQKLEVNYQNTTKDTALHIAVRKNESKVIKVLLEKGADASIKNNREGTPIDIAKKHKRDDIVAMLEGKVSHKAIIDTSAKSTGQATGGSDSDHGIEYEKRLAIALLIQGLESEYNQFSLKRQEPNAGKFDDVVLRYQYEKDGRKKWKLIQAKHKLKPERITLKGLSSEDGDFSIRKYLNEYSTIKKNSFFENSDIECVLYTNRFFPKKDAEAQELMGLLSEQKTQDPILDIKASNPKDPRSSKRYKFNAEKIEDIKKKIPSLSDVNDKELEGFLENLVFAVNQPNERELREIARAKIKEKFNDKQSVIDINSRLYEEIGKWEAKDEREFISRDWIEKFFKDTKERILGGITFEVRNPVETFTGRVKELGDLHKKMTNTGGLERTALISPQLDDSKNPASVTGLGGVGKTELARKYAEIHRGFYTDQIWIDASTFGIQGSLRDLAKKLWINEKDIDGKNKDIKTIAKEIYTFFSNNPQRKPLFIFDNAEGYKNIMQFLPGPSNNKPYVLITSRSKNWDTEEDGKIEQLNLSVFSEDEAKEFIIKSLGKNNLLEEDIKALAKELGYLPLALKQATAYIKRNEGLSIKEYLNEYKIEVEKTKKLLNSKAYEITDRYTETVFTTWQITLKRIIQEKNGDQAKEILDIISYFSADNIQSRILITSNENLEKLYAIELLKQYSMIDQGKEEGSFSIHRLVQTVIRINLKENNKEEETLKKALNLVKENLTGKNTNHGITAWKHASKYDELVKDFSKLPPDIINKLDGAIRYEEAIEFGKEAIGKLTETIGENHPDTINALHNLASTLDHKGAYDEALKLQKQVVEKRKEILGENHPDTINALNNLANTLVHQGEYDEALKLQKQVVEKRKKILGENHPDTIKALNNLASTLDNQGAYDEALKRYKQVVEKMKEILGENHPDTINALNNLANTLDNKGEYDQALKLRKQVVEKRKEILGENHPDTINALNNLAATLVHQGAYDEALKLQKQVVEKRKEILGENHPDTLTALNNLAATLDHKGAYDEALKLQKQVVEKRKEILGENHPDTINALNNLANTLDNKGAYDEALKLYKQVVEKRKEILGENHPDTLTALNNLAATLAHQGEYDEALKLQKQVVEKRKEILGENHPDTINALNNLAATLVHQGAYDEALKLQKQVVEKRKEILGENHPDTINALNNLAVTLDHKGAYDEALKLRKQVVEKRKEILGENHPDTINALNNLAATLVHQGAYDEALKLQKQVVEKRKEILGENHPDTINALNNLAVTLDHKGAYDEALKLRKQVVEKMKEILGENHPDTINALNNLAVTLDHKGAYDEALKLYKQVVEKRKEILGENHPDTISALNNLAATLVHQGAYDEALKRFKQVVEKRKEILGENHPDTLTSMNNLASTLYKKEQYDEALELFKQVVEKRKKILGEDHPDTISALSNLASTLDNKGQYDEALKLQKQVLEKMKNHKELGEDHPDTLTSMNNLASTLYKKGQYDEALELLKQVVEKRKGILGENHPDTISALHNLALTKKHMDSATLLHSATKENDLELVRDLIKKGADVNAKDDKGNTPLHYATWKGYEKIVNVLLENNADPNAVVTNKDNTALHFAAEGGNKKIIQLLLNKQANPNIKNKNGKLPLDLAHQKLVKDPENENLRAITGLLFSETFSITDQSQYQESGSARSGACPPSTSRRKKRNAEAACLLTWEDIDEFNQKQTRENVLVDSDKFIDYIKTIQSEEKRNQLIKFIDTVPIVGNNKASVGALIQNQRTLNYLNKVGRVSGITMHGMMLKNTISDLLNGNLEGVAINLGFIVGSPILSKISEMSSIKGTELIASNKLLLGRSLKLASPFLARGTSAFVAYDLFNQVKAYQGGHKDALVGVVGDGIYIGVDVAEIGIEVAEAFSILEGVSSVTGPIGAAIGAVVFVGTDIYGAVKTTDKINKIVHLGSKERFIEGIRAFFGMQPEKYLEEILQEKQVNNALVKEAIAFLKQHRDIQRYVLPTGKYVLDACKKVSYKESRCGKTALGGCFRGDTVTRYSEKCTTKFKEDLDNTVLLDKKHKNIKWSRSIPDKITELFCLPEGNHIKVPSNGAYICKNAIGVDYNTNRTGNYTLINIGDGNDYVRGEGSNIFLVGNGEKFLYGGNQDDTFVLNGKAVNGTLDGKNGVNTLDLSQQDETRVDLVKGSLGSVALRNINRIIGSNKQDIIDCDCDTVEVDGNGGNDMINVKEAGCSYNNLQIVVRPNTTINNPSRGNFKYTILPGTGEAKINLFSGRVHGVLKDTHKFFFNYKLNNLREISKQGIATRFSFGRFNITIGGVATNISYTLSDNTELKIGEKNIYAIQNTDLPVGKIIKTYPQMANRLKMTIVAQSNHETVVVGHGHHDVLHNDPEHKSHLIGNGGENIFVVTSSDVPVVIYDMDKENKIDTLDLRQTATDLELKVAGKDITIANVVLKDALATNWHERLHIITDKVPMQIEDFALKPLPLEFTDKDIQTIAIGPDDVANKSKIIISRPIGVYRFSRLNDHLIITNAFDGDLDHAVSITLKDFYATQKMQTLLIKFADKEIDIKNEMHEITNAKLFQEQVDAYKSTSDHAVFGIEQARIKRAAEQATSGKTTDAEASVASSSSKPTSWMGELWALGKKLVGKVASGYTHPAKLDPQHKNNGVAYNPALSSHPNSTSVPIHPVNPLETSFNALLGAGAQPIGPTTDPTLLEMGDQWVKNSDPNGLLTWGTLLARKWTGYRPKVSQMPSHDPAIRDDVALSIRSHEWVDACMEKVQEQAQACGIEEATSAIFDNPTLYTEAVQMVHKKLAAGQVEGITALLLEQVVQKNSNKIASTATSDQVDQLLAKIKEALPKLEQRFLQQEVLLPNQSKAAELAHTTSKAAINLLKQAMCSMQPTDQLADTTSTLHMNNTTENIFVQNSIENGNPYKTIEYGRSNRR